VTTYIFTTEIMKQNHLGITLLFENVLHTFAKEISEWGFGDLDKT